MDDTHALPQAPSRLIRWSGNVVLALIVIGMAYAVKVVLDTRRDNAEASAFIAAAVVAIVRDWNPAELTQRAAPEWLAPADVAGLPETFRHFSTLGRLRMLQPPAGRLGSGAFPGTRINGVWADYSVTGDFDAGPATFRMILKRVDDGWQISGLQVQSDAFNRTAANK
jgi:hypothetical protein